MKKICRLCLLILFVLTSCKNDNVENHTISDKIEQCINAYITKWDYKPALEVSVYGKKGKEKYNYRGQIRPSVFGR